jgi:hypothetical protein
MLLLRSGAEAWLALAARAAVTIIAAADMGIGIAFVFAACLPWLVIGIGVWAGIWVGVGMVLRRWWYSYWWFRWYWWRHGGWRWVVVEWHGRLAGIFAMQRTVDSVVQLRVGERIREIHVVAAGHESCREGTKAICCSTARWRVRRLRNGGLRKGV